MKTRLIGRNDALSVLSGGLGIWAVMTVATILTGGSPTIAATPATTTAKPLTTTLVRMDEAKFRDWLAKWEKGITEDARNRYCDKAMGEEIGWLMTPFLDGFYQGYLVTRDPKWLALEIDWTDSWIKRAVKEPDNYLGWPAKGASGTEVDGLSRFTADSMLGEAMVLRPVVLTAGEILKTPALRAKYGAKAESYMKLAEQTYEKWDKRGGWRETKNGGCISVVLPFGIGRDGRWTDGYAKRNAPGNGFSHPDNKANFVARWLLAMSDVTHRPIYRARAEKWFKLMKSRMHLQKDGTYKIWNYWEPAGPWDYQPNGSPKHWIGVHPNSGYYDADVAGIVDGYTHGLVFTQADINHLIATSLASHKKYVWEALVPYNVDIQKEFEKSLKPGSWAGLSSAPWYLALQVQLRKAGTK